MTTARRASSSAGLRLVRAVDAAVEGDLILIDKGTYYESVSVGADNIVIAGPTRTP